MEVNLKNQQVEAKVKKLKKCFQLKKMKIITRKILIIIIIQNFVIFILFFN